MKNSNSQRAAFSFVFGHFLVTFFSFLVKLVAYPLLWQNPFCGTMKTCRTASKLTHCFFGAGASIKERKKGLRKITHEISKNTTDGWASLANFPAKATVFCQFVYSKQQETLGHWPVYPCLSRRVSHLASVPRNELFKFI